ncbi:hypothetical protein [Thioalkalivibrio sulfidiphilus]|uniref:hypothetical protein n=1 Tax=Thioalkalivibrio sulfidiphilus TaxID=1033854 RepID=UPI00059B8A7C|nr:hypothetical protein [Thioalkalivibrio sulfidiphilus]
MGRFRTVQSAAGVKGHYQPLEALHLVAQGEQLAAGLAVGGAAAVAAVIAPRLVLFAAPLVEVAADHHGALVVHDVADADVNAGGVAFPLFLPWLTSV